MAKLADYDYRPDIDGLRAFAVLAVVCYHAFPTLFTGGFVGVDIFFVISGFLITAIIYKNVRTENFSFLDFYSRRIKRIFPALLTVLFFSLLVGWFVLLPDEYKQLGKHTRGGAEFMSNFMLWKESGYFDTSADTKIFLHLWSLAVEEQYYLIWPAVIWAAWKRKLNLFLVCLVILLASFFFNINTIKMSAVTAFYSPLSRFWELVLGGLLAYWSLQKPPTIQTGNDSSCALHQVAAFLGLALLIGTVFFLKKVSHFPGWLALLPTLGACLILFAGQKAWINRHLLSSRLLVWFGLISYPLYLWHWPLLAFSRNIEGRTPSLAWRSLLVLTSIVLAALTYYFIEKPLRFGKPKAWKVASLGALMILLGLAGYSIEKQDGFSARLQDKQSYVHYFEGYLYDPKQFVDERKMIAQNQCNHYDYENPTSNRPRARIDPACYTKHGSKAVLLWGDSHAAHLYYGLKSVLPAEVSVLLLFSSGCSPLQVTQLNPDPSKVSYCDKSNYFAFHYATQEAPEVVFFAANHALDIQDMRTLSHTLKQHGVKKIYVLGPLPHWKPYLYKVIVKHYWVNTPKRIRGYQDEELRDKDRQFRAQMRADEPFEYVDLANFFCNTAGCITYLGNDKKEGLMTFDDAHLRPFASTYLAKHLLAPLIMLQDHGVKS